jgi:hypothetical protein
MFRTALAYQPTPCLPLFLSIMKNHFLLLAALLGLSQCRKDPAPIPPPINQADLLPPATQTGRRTFGCLVDGKAWNLVGNPSRPAFTAQYSSTNRLSLSAIGTSSSSGTATEDIIQFSINKLITAEQYNRSGDTCSVVYKRFTTNCTYHTTSG